MRTFCGIMVTSCALALGATAPAHAQIGFGVGAGPSTPVGGLADLVDAGFHGSLVADMGLPLLPIGLRADLMFQRLPGRDDRQSFNQVSATVNGRLSVLPLPLVSAYLTAGAGLYRGEAPVPANMTATGSTTDAGINAGVGGRINLIVVRPFVEARYHRVLADPARAFIPITVGVFF
jgi:hypothetical protein